MNSTTNMKEKNIVYSIEDIKLGKQYSAVLSSLTCKNDLKINKQEIGKMSRSNSPYECDICSKIFKLNSVYQRHKKRYPGKHLYHKCCNKIENGGSAHECKKNLNKTPSKKEGLLGDVNVNEESGQALEAYKEIVDEEEKKLTELESHLEDENYVFDRKQKSCEKQLHFESDHPQEQVQKIYKCQECLEVFDKYSRLTQHTKSIHKKQGKYKCQICDEEFNLDREYEAHIVLHGPEDKVMCKGCKKTFNSLKLYYIHAKQNPSPHCFACKLCLRKFPTERMLDQHVCICQNGKPLYCACGLEFTKYDDVIEHSKGTKPFICCSCPHSSTSLTAYIRHLRKHSKQKPFQCSKCEMKFAVIDFLNIHHKKCHSEISNESIEQNSEAIQQHKCTFCEEVFSTVEDVKMHSLRHETVQCPDCGKLLKRNRLENHRNTHKTSASLCPECGKLFDTRFKLTQHIITTHNSEPVKCKVCAKVLKTKKILHEHMKTHLKSEYGGRVPQAICPMCGLGLAQKGSLARHILLTHEKHKIVPCDKTYNCKECSAVLPNRAKYYSHRRMHRAMVDRFPCEICGREFNKKQNLRRHMYLLHDEKRVVADPIFKCQICTRCFREKKNLKRHYKMVHKLDEVI